MSHIVTVQAQIRDPVALAAACRRLNLPLPIQGTASLYAGEVSGLVVRLPGWQYPVVVDTSSASLKYDNFNGAWGDQKQLDRLMQAYAIEKCRIEARRAGHQLTEQALADGSVKLTIQVGGGV